MFPHLRDVPDFKHKLWDHLAIMADFKLDIDYPYEIVPPRKKTVAQAEPPKINLLVDIQAKLQAGKGCLLYTSRCV